MTEPLVSRGQKPISAVNPFVLLPCCLNASLQTDCMSLASEAESVASSEVILCREKEEEMKEGGTQNGRDYSVYYAKTKKNS